MKTEWLKGEKKMTTSNEQAEQKKKNEGEIRAKGFCDKPLFRCKTCSTDQKKVILSWNNAEKEIIEMDDAGQATRAALYCKDCQNQFGIFTVESLPEIARQQEVRNAKK